MFTGKFSKYNRKHSAKKRNFNSFIEDMEFECMSVRMFMCVSVCSKGKVYSPLRVRGCSQITSR